MAEKLEFNNKKELLRKAVEGESGKDSPLDNIVKEYGDIFEKKGIWDNATGQYEDCIFSYQLKLKKSINGEYGDSIGEIFITPYRITKDDVTKAVKYDHNAHHFKNTVEVYPGFTDYDDTTGNFHKKPDDNGNFEYQVVLLVETIDRKGNPKYPGPGWIKKPGNDFDDDNNKNWDFRKTYIKTKYYFPEIGGIDEKNYYSIEELLRQALDYIGISKRDEVQ